MLSALSSQLVSTSVRQLSTDSTHRVWVLLFPPEPAFWWAERLVGLAITAHSTQCAHRTRHSAHRRHTHSECHCQ